LPARNIARGQQQRLDDPQWKNHKGSIMSKAVVLLDADSVRGRTACVFLQTASFAISHDKDEAGNADIVVCDAEDIPAGSATVFVMYRPDAMPTRDLLQKLVGRRYLVGTAPGASLVLAEVVYRLTSRNAEDVRKYWPPAYFFHPDDCGRESRVTGVIGNGSEDVETIFHRVEEAYRCNLKIQHCKARSSQSESDSSSGAAK
jgi:hypothetical protein